MCVYIYICILCIYIYIHNIHQIYQVSGGSIILPGQIFVGSWSLGFGSFDPGEGTIEVAHYWEEMRCGVPQVPGFNSPVSVGIPTIGSIITTITN